MKFKVEASEANRQYIWLTIDSTEICLEPNELRELNIVIGTFLETLEDRTTRVVKEM